MVSPRVVRTNCFNRPSLLLRATAVKYYEQSGNNARAFSCYTYVEDFAALEKLSQSLQDNDILLKVNIFKRFLGTNIDCLPV